MGWLKFGGNVGVRGQLDVSIDPNTTGGLNIKRGGLTVDAGGITVTLGNTELSGGTTCLDSGTSVPDHDALSGALSIHRIGGASGTSRLYLNPGNGTTYYIDADGTA